MESAVEWVRNMDASELQDIDGPSLEALAKLSGLSLPDRAITSSERRVQAVENSLNWLRNNDLNWEDVDDPTVKALSKVAGIPIPKRLTSENKKKTLETAIDWLRNMNATELQDIDDPTLDALTKLAGIPMPGDRGITREHKSEVMEDAITWLRNNDVNTFDIDEP